MSWNIYVYAEFYDKHSNTWQPLLEGSIFNNFKWYDDCFYDSMNNICVDSISQPEIKALANDNMLPRNTVKGCSLDEFRRHYEAIASEFDIKLKSAYSALGVRLCIEDDEYYTDDEDERNNDTSNVGSDYLFKRMTFPVNKELMNDIAISFGRVQKAYEMLGFASTLESLSRSDCDIRLLFVMM